MCFSAPSDETPGREVRCDHDYVIACPECAQQEIWHREAMMAGERPHRHRAGRCPHCDGGDELARMLALVHQPNPTDPARWDVAPGKHREFQALIAEWRALQPSRNTKRFTPSPEAS